MRYRWWCAAILTGLAGAAWCQNYSAPKKPTVSPVSGGKDQARCPWLTEGTAADALGGEVRVVVSVAGPLKGMCSFVRQDNTAEQLKVVIGPDHVPSCPQGSARVVGVGSRANRCKGPASEGESARMISGAVRETGMAVVLTRPNSQAAKSSAQVKRDVLEEIAEQVAGNLF